MQVYPLFNCPQNIEHFLELRWARRPMARRIILVVAILFIAVGIVASFQSNQDLSLDIGWEAVAIVLVLLIPITIALNAVEFILIGHSIGTRSRFFEAVEITIIGTAANMLPLPGGTMVRIAALKAGGADFKKGASGTLLVAMIWLSLSFLYAGMWIHTLRPGLVSTSFLVIGVASTLVCFLWSNKLGSSRRTLYLTLLTKGVLVVVDSLRLYLCLLAVGADASFAQASTLAVSGVLGSAVSIVPAGLGVREVVASMVGLLVGLAASFSFVAASLNRILGLVFILPIAGILALRSGVEGDEVDVRET